MHLRLPLSLLPVAAGLLLSACAARPVEHQVLVQGNGQLAIVEPDGSISWSMDWGGIHDLHVLQSGNVMVQRGAREVVEIDRSTKEVVWSYDSASSSDNEGRPVEVHAFQPLSPNVEESSCRVYRRTVEDSLYPSSP